MSDKQDESVAQAAVDTSSPSEEIVDFDPANLPNKMKYRSFFGLPWYASPKTQLIMVAFVCFCCPGMFNALSGLGGGGKTDPTLADHMVSLTTKIYLLRPGMLIVHRILH